MKTAVAESLGTQQLYGIAVAARLPLTLVAIDVRLQELMLQDTRATMAVRSSSAG